MLLFVRGVRYFSSITAALSLTLALGSTAALASPKAFSIDSEDAPRALLEFGRQAAVQILFATEKVKGIITNAVHGDYEPIDALKLLLKGTPLVVSEKPDGVLVVELAKGHNSSNGNPESGTGAGSSALMAQADVPNHTQSASGNPQNTNLPGSTSSPSSESEKDKISEIIVTGTHIRGLTEIAAPTTEITREEFIKSGDATLEQVLGQLPQNLSDISPAGIYSTSGASQLAQFNHYDRASAADLRGLGAQSTLTLIDGERRAGVDQGRVVDISAIPLSIVEKVEVVTGGRSAVYGSDAVAGVVNIITRKDFDGAETQVNAAGSRGGADRIELSQIVGSKATNYGFVAAYDYTHVSAFDLSEAGLTEDTPYSHTTRLLAQPYESRHSVYLAGHYDISPTASLYTDAQYSYHTYHDRSDSVYLPASGYPDGSTFSSLTQNSSRQFNVSAGVNLSLPQGWNFKLDGNLSGADSKFRNGPQLTTYGMPYFGDSFYFYDEEDPAKTWLKKISAVADGSLPAFLGVEPRVALGAEFRHESIDGSILMRSSSTDVNVPFGSPQVFGLSRNIRSGFGELYLPLVPARDTSRSARLELTVAGRYDHYSDFGNSVNPQFGVIVRPSDELTLRATYSHAFVAPDLYTLTQQPYSYVTALTDPKSAAGTSPTLFVGGTRPDLGPEKAKTTTAGFDYRPQWFSNSRLSISYIEISYENRIDVPDAGADPQLVLQQGSFYPAQVIRNPSAALVQSFVRADTGNYSGIPWDPATQTLLAAIPNLVVFDNRTANIALEKLRAVDLDASRTFEGLGGNLTLGLSATYTISDDRNTTFASPTFSQLDAVGKLPHAKGRARADWSRGAFGTSLYLNYTQSYADPFTTPASRVGAWTTADFGVHVDGAKLNDGALFKSLKLSLNVQNVLDRRPPFVAGSLDNGLSFDGVNASPYGRYASLQITKSW